MNYKEKNNKELISVKNVSKKFCRNLKRSMIYGLQDIMFFNTAGRLRKDEFWALKEVSFKLYKGDRLGILGLNGAGKTTLMRLINGIYQVTSGKIVVNGRVASIFDKSRALNRFYSGRENLFVKGALHGLSKSEIKNSLQDIIEFAELGSSLDAPFGTYSSGMRVRLNFAAVLAINPDVLVIDEGLSLGDASFKKKCFENIKMFSDNKAVISISHNIDQIVQISNRILVLDNGKLVRDTKNVSEGIDYYYSQCVFPSKSLKNEGSDEKIKIEKCWLNSDTDDPRKKEVDFNILNHRIVLNVIFNNTFAIKQANIRFQFLNSRREIVAIADNYLDEFYVQPGSSKLLQTKFENIRLNPDTYNILMTIKFDSGRFLAENTYLTKFRVISSNNDSKNTLKIKSRTEILDTNEIHS